MVAKYEGEVFGQLTVRYRNGVTGEGRAVWACTCACGEDVQATSKQLTTGVKVACQNCQDSGSKSPLHVRLRKYVLDPTSGCWLWTGKQNQHGYGTMVVDGVETRSHRAMYFMLNPTADRTKVVMHKCDNPRCINPEHLQLGTQQENIMDMHAKGRFKGGAPLGNKNAIGNTGWTKGGVTLKYASKMGDEVDVPDALT